MFKLKEKKTMNYYIMGSNVTYGNEYCFNNFIPTYLNLTTLPVRGMSNSPVDKKTYDFEGELLDVLNNKSFYPDGLFSAPNLQRSFSG